MAFKRRLTPSQVIRQSGTHNPWDQGWAKTPRTQKEAGIPYEPLPDSLSFRDTDPLHPHVDRTVFIVVVIAGLIAFFFS